MNMSAWNYAQRDDTLATLAATVEVGYGWFMRRLWSLLSSLLAFAVFAVMVAFFVHLVTTDTVAVRRLADEEICIGQRTACHSTYSLLERNALGVSIDYETPFHRIVQCRRKYLFVGDYACAVVTSAVGGEQPGPKDEKAKPNGPALQP